MATASPIDPAIDPVLESAVRKLRAREALTDAERAAVRTRGMELLEEDLTDEAPPRVGPMQPEDEGLEDEEQDEDELFEDLVLLDANDREGRQGIPAAEFLEQLRAIG
jgi:hypothetical protein